MDRHFDALLAGLKSELTRMSALAEGMIGAAIALLVERDESAIAAIREHEGQVNRLQIQIDEDCLTLIALHQPAASDLRFILGAAKTNTELERLADQAVNICDKAEWLLREPQLKPYDILPRMAAIACGMLRDSLHAYVNRDVQQARGVLARDDEVDGLKRTVTEELIGIMQKDSGAVRRSVALLLIARNLERIGDHATNIAENAIFVAEGKDIRHRAEMEDGSRAGHLPS
jgi:phosphate transport system protein